MNADSFLDDLTEDDSRRTQEIFVMASIEDQELSVQCSLVTDDTNINRTMNFTIQGKFILIPGIRQKNLFIKLDLELFQHQIILLLLHIFIQMMVQQQA